MARRQVDLPDPLGPMIATRSPAATSKLTPLRTESRPKRFWRPVTRSRGAVSAIAHQGKPFTKEKPTARAEPGPSVAADTITCSWEEPNPPDDRRRCAG